MTFGILVLGITAIVGTSLGIGWSGRGPHSPAERIVAAGLPRDVPVLGMVYDGLAPGEPGSVCAGAYRLGPQTCTHGPDPAPAGLNVRRGVEPVTGRAPGSAVPVAESARVIPDADILRDAGGSAAFPGAPSLVPEAARGDADFVLGSHGVACEGDGQTGKRVQALYAYERGTRSRFQEFAGSIQKWTSGVDRIVDASAGDTGGSRHVRFVTTPGCAVDVTEVQLPAGSLGSFARSIDALGVLGYNRTDRKYLVFVDATVYCGIGTYVPDGRTGFGNRNNGGPSYGRVDAGCWGPVPAARELGEMLGALRPDTRPGACTARLDCGDDDFFSTDPRPGGYLATHWNAAANEFLLRGDGGDDIPDVPGGPAQSTPGATGSGDATTTDAATLDDPAASVGQPTGGAPATDAAQAGDGDQDLGAGGSAPVPDPAAAPNPAAPNPAAGPDPAAGHGNGNGTKAKGDKPTAGRHATGTTGTSTAGSPAAATGGSLAAGSPAAATAAGSPAAGTAVTQANGLAATSGGSRTATTGGSDRAAATGSGDRAPTTGGSRTATTGAGAGTGTTSGTGTTTSVQAAVEVRDPTSTAVHLMWSTAGPGVDYRVAVDGRPVGTTLATRARLIGLRPDTSYTITVENTRLGYRARSTGRTAPAARPAPGSWFVLTNALTGGAADLYAARADDGTPITLGDSDGGAPEQWQLAPVGGGGYTLRSRATGRCVLPLHGVAVPGAPLVQGDCAAPGVPRWVLRPSDHGCTLRTAGGLVIGVGGQRFGGDRILTLQTPAGARQQSWTAVPG